MPAIKSYTSHFSDLWESSPEVFPEFDHSYSQKEQAIRELRFSILQEKLKKFQSKEHRKALMEGDAANSFFPVFRVFLETVFDFEPAHLEIILSDSFKNVSKDFFYRARQFGPDLSPESIYQGLRNVWIMNGLQLMMGLPVEISPSVFAYSMIYPYSDNLLDDAVMLGSAKKQFSDRFNRRLHGEAEDPMSFIEKQLYSLVSMIESQYSRQDYPGVYESLYSIQEGQTRSLELINCNGLEEKIVREICFKKGGASVLADGYLVAGKLSSRQERALFGYGIYLQLLDDIQDIKEDTKGNTKTLFACRGEFGSQETFLYKTIHFGRAAMEELRCFEGTLTDSMLGLMNRSIETMIIESVGLNPESFPGNCQQQFENYSPLRFKFLRDKKAKSKSQRFSLFKKYFEQEPPPATAP